MNKGVTIAGGVILLLSVILTVAGGAITANSGDNLENIDDSPQPFYTASEGGSTTFAFIDEDLAGSLAFQVLLDLDYVDEDGDGYVDSCGDYAWMVKDEDGVVVTSNVSRIDCKYHEWIAEDPLHDGKVVHSEVCGTIPELSGTEKCNLDSNYTVQIMYTYADATWNQSRDFVLFDQDAYTIGIMEEALDDFAVLAGAGSLAFIALCCGLPIGLIVLIIGLAIGGPQPKPVMMQRAYAPVIGQMQA
ncbi:MAG: hypothetical protein CL981_04570, partial [Euryarchaeota archaeon]|nr:hypothetical protein [Euryarchaeota archaeon]